MLVLFVGHNKAVGRAAVNSIHSKVDSFSPITVVGIIYVESSTIVDDYWIGSTGPMPKPQALG
jgi:hypothetical protein